MKVSEFFLTIYFWTLTLPSLLITFFICVLCYPFMDEKTFARCYELIMGKTLLLAMVLPGFWKIKITDLRRDKSWIDLYGREKRFVVIANHVSYIDSLVSVLIPIKKKFLMALIFTRVPIFGFLTKHSGYVTAEKGNPTLNKTAVNRAINAIRKDSSSFQVYVEGRREIIPYKFEPFKTGAYRIAYQTGLEILPVTLKGTYDGMHGATVGFADIEIVIDEPFAVRNEDYPFYIDKSKKLFSKNLGILAQ